jgi:putative addiction module component (TIGR02574 family)
VDFAEALSAINAMSIDDRIRLAEAIWEGIEAEQELPELTEAQKQELDRRMAELDAHPETAVPWEEVWAKAKARFRR